MLVYGKIYITRCRYFSQTCVLYQEQAPQGGCPGGHSPSKNQLLTPDPWSQGKLYSQVKHIYINFLILTSLKYLLIFQFMTQWVGGYFYWSEFPAYILANVSFVLETWDCVYLLFAFSSEILSISRAIDALLGGLGSSKPSKSFNRAFFLSSSALLRWIVSCLNFSSL